ncbi:MAG: hypothetical protein IPH57_05815 [Saprospiraceae bacterium]|nr:hypothetical protein [Saprospiraceae bacterium]
MRFLYTASKTLLVFILLLLNVITLALATPSIQNSLSDKITGFLTARTGFEVSLNHINLNLSKGLQLADVLILDLNKDTLLSAKPSIQVCSEM